MVRSSIRPLWVPLFFHQRFDSHKENNMLLHWRIFVLLFFRFFGNVLINSAILDSLWLNFLFCYSIFWNRAHEFTLTLIPHKVIGNNYTHPKVKCHERALSQHRADSGHQDPQPYHQLKPGSMVVTYLHLMEKSYTRLEPGLSRKQTIPHLEDEK